MRGFCLLLVVFATLYQLASAQNSQIQRQLRAEQEDIACTLRDDDTLRSMYEHIIRALHGVQPNFSELTACSCVDLRSDTIFIQFHTKILFSLAADSTRQEPGEVNYNTRIRCRAARECSGDTEIVWCINMYHPSKEIEMCWNFSSGEISITDYAKQLGIDEVLFREVFLLL